MRVVFWPLLALLLTITVFTVFPETRTLGAPPEQKPDKQAAANEEFDPNSLFPLGKRNGVHIRAESSASPDGMIVRHNFVPSFVRGQKKLKWVLAHPEDATAIQLGVAADMSYRAGNLRDAAFLYYAARLRAAQDLEKYPPKDAQGTSTEWFLSVVIDGVKIDLLRELYAQPKTLAEVVKRIEAFELEEPTGYNPGWDYARHDVPADLFAKNKAALIESIKPMSDLLLLPDYFQAFCVYREFNNLSEKDQKNPATVEARAKAANAMKRIEKEKGLHGVMFQVDSKPID
jgi:hypothetical protein